MSLHETEQALLGKVVVAPLLMILTPSPAALARPISQEGAQPSAHILVHPLERCLVTVFEVSKPAAQHFVQLLDAALERLTARASRGQFTDSRFQLVDGLGPRPAVAALEVVTKEVEAALLGGIDDARFLGMQLQAVFPDPRLHADQGGFGFFPAATEDNEVARRSAPSRSRFRP